MYSEDQRPSPAELEEMRIRLLEQLNRIFPSQLPTL